ncbi:MAG TPA: RNA polymerase sigma factor [Polyangia bacterium]
MDGTAEGRTDRIIPTESQPKAARFDLARLVARHGNALYGRAMSLARHPEEARDLLHDSFERALVAGPVTADDDHAIAWLYVVMRNIFLDRMRVTSRFASTVVPESIPAPEAEPRDARSDVDMSQLRAAVAKLAPAYREVYERHVFERQSYLTIAEVMRLAPGTVGSRLKRARAKLKEKLEEDQDRVD